jgi:exonuclease SbcC
MKFLILNDSHDKGNNPVRRTDGYHKSILEKLDETLSIAKDKKVDKIIHGGDVWHTPNVSWTIIDDWVDRIESCGIEMLVVPGNHDMDGASWETSGKTALYHAFKRSKLLTFLDEFSGEDCFVKGYPYYFDCELDIKENGLKHKKKLGLTIAVTHAFISPEPFPFSNYVLPKEIKSNYDYVICSHLHKAFDITVGKTRYINLGCFGRTAISEAKHNPQIGILDTEKNTYDIIPLKSSKKGKECLEKRKTHLIGYNVWIGKLVKSIV